MLIAIPTTVIGIVVVGSPANAPFDVESTKAGLEVVPRSPGPTAVTEKGSTANLNVQLVQIGGIVSGRFGTKGAFPQDHMRIGGPGALDTGIAIVLGAVLENAFGRHVDGIVVSADECPGIVVVRRHVP